MKGDEIEKSIKMSSVVEKVEAEAETPKEAETVALKCYDLDKSIKELVYYS